MLKKTTFLLLLCFNVLLLKAQESKVKVIQVPEMLEVVKPGQNLKVINFWATWCKPCIKELPHFVEAAKANPNVEFIFISLDFADQVNKTEVFAAKKELSVGELYLIDDLDYNSWIDKISTEWSGAIPFTLIVSQSGKEAYEKEFQEGELGALIKQKLNNN